MTPENRAALLKAFCGSEPRYANLMRPFVQDKWVYATNGAMIIRLPATEADGSERVVLQGVYSCFPHVDVEEGLWEELAALPPRFVIGKGVSRTPMATGDIPCVQIDGAWFQARFIEPILRAVGPVEKHLTSVMEEKPGLLVRGPGMLEATILPCVPAMKPVAVK